MKTTAEEILSKYEKITSTNTGRFPIKFHDALKAMEEYARLRVEEEKQSQQAVIMPTNRKIEKEGRIHYNPFKDNDFSIRLIAWCTGANWFKSQIKVVDLRKELKRFNSWMCGKQYDGKIPLIGQCINEYLNQREK